MFNSFSQKDKGKQLKNALKSPFLMVQQLKSVMYRVANESG